MATKRPADDSSGSAGPAAKKALTRIEPLKIGPISNLEELDLKVLVFQNKKLAERIEQRKRAESELHKRIEQLENRQRTDDAVLMIVNRYWNQLDEDARVLLQRFDAETADENETKNESDETTAFLALLSTWDKQELEEKLSQRVEFSKRAIGKLLQAFDRLLQRNEKLHKVLENKAEKDKEDLLGVVVKPTKESDEEEEEKDDDKADGDKKEEEEDGKEDETQKKLAEIECMVKEELDHLRKENKQLHNLVTNLHQRHHEHTLKISELQDQVTASETEIAEMKNKVDDLDYQFEKADQRCEKLDRHLSEAFSKLRNYEETTGAITVEGIKSIGGVSKTRLDEILSELEEQRELATNRLSELEKLNKDHQEACKEVEKLKMDLQHLPEAVIIETTEYKCLQSQFSVLYNESMAIRTQLEDVRNQLQNNKNGHLRHIEQMESDELACQKKLRTEMIQLEDMLAQLRKEYEMLRIEFEQTLAANEQTGTINREMRNLIQSLQNHNQQLKMESARYKRRLKETQVENARLKAEGSGSTSSTPSLSSDTKEIKEEAPVTTPPATIKLEPELLPVKKEEDLSDDMAEYREKGKTDSEVIKELRVQLKKAQDSQKELKLLLDMYKSAPKEQRDKVMLMASEKKSRQEMEEIRAQIKKMQEAEKKERRKLAEEDAIRKIRKNEETILELQKNLASQKQREEALLNDLEVTGQAFEDMQEQNTRLLQQLREKDDANFKLMSERIKSNQIQKLLREEKDILVEQVSTLQLQVEAQNQVVRKLEEKERILQNNLSTVEKELSLTQQAMEMHKRKAVESSQTAADLKLHLDKYQSQLKEAQVAVAEKTGALEQEAYKYKRTQEEIAKLQRKLERSKKIEMAGAADEVLLEEIKEYKEQLTCPSCKVNRKDAVLTKCFHVFCLECLRTRYETRQRKCPKCNAGFGANDFHRLYLT
ncbi:E3 ubiquitin-protein ligase Bre1-like [Haliotis rufescens]|uniref:E3 ubiquitin-protein ligase Bre1-like n=1 Tax=Haliotis rufescens TaxID=6454 RepID=UPI001EAFC85D|nr:E3 ubiquitin-protein ligase Bre1-like [Haliotis rufescens]